MKSLEVTEVSDELLNDLLEDFALLFTAGTDTTSNSSLMMIHYCIQNTSILEKVLKEISENIESDEDIQEEKLKKIQYLDAVFRETMRIYAPLSTIFMRHYFHVLVFISMSLSSLGRIKMKIIFFIIFYM